MSNKVAVAYNLISAGGSTVGIRRTTPWVADAESINKYGGVKELLESGGSLNSVEALSMATRLRNELKYPRVLVNPGGEGGSRQAGVPGLVANAGLAILQGTDRAGALFPDRGRWRGGFAG